MDRAALLQFQWGHSGSGGTMTPALPLLPRSKADAAMALLSQALSNSGDLLYPKHCRAYASPLVNVPHVGIIFYPRDTSSRLLVEDFVLSDLCGGCW